MWEATGECPEELTDLPELPPGVAHIWEWFCELHVSAENILTYQEIQSWTQITGKPVSPREARTLRDLSRRFLTVTRKLG